MVGISPMAIHYYEENKWRPGTEVIVRLANALDVELTESGVGYRLMTGK